MCEQPAQPFHATCREAHWHTWLQDSGALYLLMNYASAAVTLKNAITSVMRQMGRFCLAYAVHLLSLVWAKKPLLTHTNRARGNLPVSTVLNRGNPSGHNKKLPEWTDLIVDRWCNGNWLKSMEIGINQWQEQQLIKYGKLKMGREGQTWQKAGERYSISKAMRDKMSQLTAWGVIKVIPLPDHTGMLFTPLTLLHYPHSHLL